MTKENKELLLKDLCGRLPYGVKFRYKYIDNFFHESYSTSTLDGVLPPYRIIHSTLVGEEYLQIEEDDVKPYLFPLSSMTEEQKEELFFNYIHNDIYFDDFTDYFLAGELWHDICVSIDALPKLIDWFNKNHFDFRCLIPKGLAIDASGLNIY